MRVQSASEFALHVRLLIILHLLKQTYNFAGKVHLVEKLVPRGAVLSEATP